jgi:hypothetical protein
VDEIWNNTTDETDNHRGGDGAKKITSTGSIVYTWVSFSSIDLSAYSDGDFVDLLVYVSDISKVEICTLILESGSSSDNYNYSLVSELITGWNQVRISKASFSEFGSPNWNNITSCDVHFKTDTGETAYIIVDEIRMVDSNHYPGRKFDIGLQNIPVAWWAGNTALYEIKTACEAEGARFYADEYGDLHFENRQHYNLNPEHKSSVWGFLFDRMTDLEYPKKETDLINKVVVRLKPRRVVDSAEEVWRYGFTPSIAASATKEIWASLIDPCPTTEAGIIEPVASTDYTANTQADGGGTDKTAEVDISITRFANAVKLELTNNDAGTVYITLLKLRGTPAKESDQVIITEEDATSIAQYGERPSGGMDFDNKYLADEAYAVTRAQQLIEWYKDPKTRLVLKSRAVPHLQLGDMISVTNKDIGQNYLMRVTCIKSQFSLADGLQQEIHCRSIAPQETLTYFEIGASEIGGSDVIAP